MTILEKIKENSQKYSDRLMMVQELDDGSYNNLSWKELGEQSDRLAFWLDKNLKTKTPIVVYGHKNPLMIVLFMACVKSGRAYCPIDINVPISRAEAIVNETKPEIILTTESLELNEYKILSISEIRKIIEETNDVISPERYVKKEDVFYIIFTSGSTGVPKGVQITRDCLDNFISWALTLGNGFNDNKEYTFINQAPFSFDLSVMDLFLCLYTGGTLWSLSKAIQADMKKLYESLNKSNANVWVSTPSFADVCLADPVFNGELMPKLTDFFFCGEILTNKTVDRLISRFPNSKIVNTYGPTESTCAITQIEITKEINENSFPLPIGRAKPGTWLKIVDENLNEVKNGEHGEIMIVGDSVSVGYWNNPEMNAKAFGISTINGKEYRSYRTGDEGYLVDDVLYYCGRIDLQIKLHGYRIELGDIENSLLKIDGISQAVVVPKYRDGKVSSLVACVISSKNELSEEERITNIKSELKNTLPEYMIPRKIMFVDDMPRTNNGKINRKALQEIV